MKNYLSLGILWLIGIIVIYFYYIGYPVHGEVKDTFFFLYLFLVSILYISYKVLQNLNSRSHIIIKPSYLIYGFFTQYLLICIYFFVVLGQQPGLGMLLFFKSLLYIISATIIWLSFYCFGKKILSLHKTMHIEDPSIEILVSIGVGFIISMFLVFITVSFGVYTFSSILILFGVIIGISIYQWKELILSFQNFSKIYIRSTGQIWGSTSLIIDEFLFILITFLLSVNFLSVFRPFPIGWDDLGAYMNFPKLLSGAGEHIALGKMYMWELYTGIGFLAGSQTFAFYLNSFAGVIAVIAIYLSINSFTRFTKQKYNFGLLASSIFLMMPMVVFQVAKDMKLDIGLFSMSVIALSLLYYILFSGNKINYILYGILGMIIGLAFAIKVTSLLLLLGILATLFYNKFKTLGFLLFLLLFIGVFSIANLWGVINIVVPGSRDALTNFGYLSVLGGFVVFAILLVTKKIQDRSDIGLFLQQLLSLLLGFIVVLSPWVIKHIGEIPDGYKSGVSTLITGVPERYLAEYSSIYTEGEIEEIESKLESGINQSGTTSNADWGRYFGYEKGINNFLKLPWNLTFQTNQKGEFTDITFLFLALIPGIFLFLPYRREVYKYPVVGVIALALLYFVPNPISGIISGAFANIILPAGYAIIVGLFLLPIMYFSWALDKKERVTNFFLVNLAFLTIYMGLWAVSSYGVVWYGIVMYFVFLVLISLCMISVSEEKNIHNYLSYSVLAFIIIYAFQSAIPHGISNIKSAGYEDYKVGGFNEEVSLMSYHPEYFSIMFELNISDNKKQELFTDYRKRLLMALSTSSDFEQVLPQIQGYSSMNELYRLIVELTRVNFPDRNIDTQIQELRQDLYELVIYTPKEIKNIKNIYRAGTFLRYFISENNTRLLEDNLLMSFDSYIYDEDASVVQSRFEKLDIDYVLIDLNAATIDNDPEKNLTRRYENMLRFVANANVELIETDSICLRIAKDTYEITQDIEGYISVASVNHNSEFTQSQKRQACFGVIQQIISNDESLAQYPYINGYKNALIQAEIDINNKDQVIAALSQLIRGNGFKALFKIN